MDRKYYQWTKAETAEYNLKRAAARKKQRWIKKNGPLPLPPMAVFDCETDPFEAGHHIYPFAIGYWDGTLYTRFWGDDCKAQFIAFLQTQPPTTLYAHNGGKFDFLFMMEHVESPMLIIDGRVVTAKLCGHDLRDSYSIIPQSLASATGNKLEFDYAKMHMNVREQYKDEIDAYLKQDCLALYDLVMKFRVRFGPKKITVASTAIAELKKFHKIENLSTSHDGKFRQFYFGGRCEFFEQGVLRSKPGFKVYDVNSMYPYCMKAFDHPIGKHYLWTNDLDYALAQDKPFFIHFEGSQREALPTREKAGLSFRQATGEFFSVSHEFLRARIHGRVTVDRVRGIWIAKRVQRFTEFVDHFNAEKIAAGARGDLTGRVFAKLMMNSAYGKFGQDPSQFKDWFIRKKGEPWPKDMDLHTSAGTYDIFSRPNPKMFGYFDVAVAASITSAARAVLFEALMRARRPIYCDTDSIICEDLSGVPMDQDALGAFKLEATGKRMAMAGKKLYALFKRSKCVKSASKGVRLSPAEILKVAQGEEILWEKESPSIKLSGEQTFLSRKVKMLGKVEKN
jgi:hypothetical protein